MNRPKEVNKNWAINLINEVEPSSQKDRIVACDGGGGPLGHPKVYINLVCYFYISIIKYMKYLYSIIYMSIFVSILYI